MQQATYGFKQRSRAKVLALLEAKLGAKFELHDSSYVGEYELLPPLASGSIELRLRDNLDPADRTKVHEDPAGVTVLLELHGPAGDVWDTYELLIRELGAVRVPEPRSVTG